MQGTAIGALDVAAIAVSSAFAFGGSKITLFTDRAAR